MRSRRLFLLSIAFGLGLTAAVRASEPVRASTGPAPATPALEPPTESFSPLPEKPPPPAAQKAAAPAGTDQPAPAAAVAASSSDPSGEPAPDDLARSLLVLAQRMADRGDRDSAETAYKEILDSAADPQLKQQALLAFAEFLRTTGRNVRAAAIYEKFLAEYPNSGMVPTVLVSLGRTLREMGAFESALARFYAVLNSTLAVKPENIGNYRSVAQVAKFEIAETHYQQGDYASAGKYFGRIKLLDLPPEEQARAAFREAYAFYLDNKLEPAVAALRTFAEGHPGHPSVQEARYLICVSLRRLGHTPEALQETLALLRAAHSASAGDREKWAYWQRKTGNQLANDFYEQGDYSAALAVYSTLADLRGDPGWRWPALYQVGLCYERLRQGDRSAGVYRLILKEAEAAAKAGTKLGSDESDVQRMAEWRLSQTDWAAGIDKNVSAYAAPAGPPKITDVPH